VPEPPYRCSFASSARDEPIFATASSVRRWLLLEQPGPWGYDAISNSRLPDEVGVELRKRARAAGVRVVMLRRGRKLAGPGRRCYLARTDGQDDYFSELTLDRPSDVLDLDLFALSGGGSVAGATPRDEPVFLVCTHGRHDACCSIRGNAVSRVACADQRFEAWECSHIGGDRFAANVVCFPHGVYYGRVAPDEVAELMDAYADGKISLSHYRGRCAYPFAVQAAEYFVRRETGVTRVHDVTLVGSERDGDRAHARFELAGGVRADVEIEIARGSERYRLTCSAQRELPIPHYKLVGLRITRV
jgi:hypothetical protein